MTVVVAIYAPELLPELGEFWTPVAAAVVGNIAGQVVANVIGIQNGFDWKSVAVAAVTAGITQGLTSEGTLPPATSTAPADVALRAAVGTAVNQGARIVVGLQEDFSWRAVAASYVGAYAGAEVSNAIGEGQYGVSAEDWAKMNADKAQYAQLMGDFSNNFTRQFASGVVNSVVTTAVSGGKLDLAHLAGDAFGNAFGSAWGSYLVYGSQQQTTLQQTQQNAAPLTAADVEDTELGAAMRSYGLTFVPGAIPFETFAEGSASAPLYDPWAPREMQGSVGTGPLPPELGGNPLESLQTLELRPGDTVAMKNFASGMADNFAITASNSTISDDQLNGILNAAQQNADRVAQGQRSDLLYADASGMLGTRTAGPAVEDIGGGPTNAGGANSTDAAAALAKLKDMAERYNAARLEEAAARGEDLAPTRANADRLGLIDTSLLDESSVAGGRRSFGTTPGGAATGNPLLGRAGGGATDLSVSTDSSGGLGIQVANGVASMALTALFGGGGPTKVSPEEYQAWRAANPNLSVFGGQPEVRYNVDFESGSINREIVTGASMGEQLLNVLSVGFRPVGNSLGNFFGGLSVATDENYSLSTRRQGAYDVGQNILAPAEAAGMVIGGRALAEGGAGIPNAVRLSEAEQATAARLQAQTGVKLQESPHVGADYVDHLGRTYDALGGPKASQFWDESQFLGSIDSHLLKSNNFTVVDLTGFTHAQIATVRNYVNSLPTTAQGKIIKIGF